MKCHNLQQKIEQRYDISIPCSVDSFVCHDQAVVSKLIGKPASEPEMLLIQQQEDNLDLTLYLEQRLANTPLGAVPPGRLSPSEFDDYCTVLEGVSHFVYVVWNAGFGKEVKPVEMELQAEVDKFVFAARGETASAQQIQACRLRQQLFRNVHIVAEPGTALHERYRTANILAEQYCSWLTRQFDLLRPSRQLDAELARFYRMNARDKIYHIDTRN